MNVKPQIHVGTDSFTKLLLENNLFVDKSLLMKECLEMRTLGSLAADKHRHLGLVGRGVGAVRVDYGLSLEL